MQLSSYLINNQTATVVGLPPRVVLAVTDKSVIKPAREARGAGTKRGYDYINLIEFGIYKRLIEMGHGIQSVKSILSDLRDEELIKKWVHNDKELFRKYYQMAGFSFLPINDTPKAIARVRSIDQSFKEMFYIEPMKTKKTTGVLFCFFGGALNRRYVIVPQISFTRPEKLLGALKHIYRMLLSQEAVIVLNIGKIKNKIDKALRTYGLT